MQISRLEQALARLCIFMLGLTAIFLLYRMILRALARGKHIADIHEQPVLEPVNTRQVDPKNLPYNAALPETIVSAQGNKNRRTLAVVGAALLIAAIVGTSLYSTHLISLSFLQAGSQVDAARASVVLYRPAFERGIIYPQYAPTGYGAQDVAWQQDISPMKLQTDAQWIEIPVLFSQAAPGSTTVDTTYSTTQVSSFIEGVQQAHALGFKVFFVPLMQVRQTGMWSGSITFSTIGQMQTWMSSYWNAIQPYVAAAASLHVEQMAVGTELQTLQQSVPALLWNQLITQVRSVFKNTLTYDMNWSSLDLPLPSWLENPDLAYIGVSTYIPLLTTPGKIDPQAIPALWKAQIKTRLDALAIQLNKQVLITEIGYRNSSDALYHTWEATSKAKADPAEQAGAYEAVLSNVLPDNQIAGTFFWGWDNVDMFNIKGQPATQVMQKWYSLTTAQPAK